ncbi:MAG: hypothetical protein ACRDSK_18240 [Actinophytocola sp.]|uniref:hypothetical protein n=1 Tax=Actinophytocola sp. TaxID=1872138 RepID=UPI003D6A1DC8
MTDQLLDDLRTLAMVNYGHFTSMRVDGGRVRGLGRRLERLDRDARELFGRGVPADLVRGRLREAVADAQGPVYAKVSVFARRFDPAVAEHDPTSAPGLVRSSIVEYEQDPPHSNMFGSLSIGRVAGRCGDFSEATESSVSFVSGDDPVVPTAPALSRVAIHRSRTAQATRGARVGTRPAVLSSDRHVRRQPDEAIPEEAV